MTQISYAANTIMMNIDALVCVRITDAVNTALSMNNTDALICVQPICIICNNNVNVIHNLLTPNTILYISLAHCVLNKIIYYLIIYNITLHYIICIQIIDYIVHD